MRRIPWFAMIVVGLVPLVGCAGTTDRRWSEEVPLSDGSVMVVDRYVKFKSSNSLAGDAYSSTDLESTLTFTEDLSATPPWSAPLVPIVLYRDEKTKEWVIVATTGNCDTWYQQGKPSPPYWEFRLQGKNWVKAKLSDASIGRKTNLFFDYETSLPAKSLSQELKGRILASKDFAKDYLGVSANAKPNCGY